MNYKYHVELTPESFSKAAQEIEQYRTVTLPNKLNTFVQKLSEVGIAIARQRLGTSHYRDYITFTKQVGYDLENGATVLMIATETGKIQQTWITDASGATKTVDVSPLLMAEFGSGKYATEVITLPNGTKVGRGTFPDGTHGNEDLWSWKTELEGEWHHSSGYKPEQPMFWAYITMLQSISEIANEVFR